MPEPEANPEEEPDVANVEDVDEVLIDYQKTAEYRNFEVEGIHGGITPRGKIQFYLYSENNLLPDETTREVIDEETLGPEEHHRESGARVVREVEASMSMSVETALSVFKVLAEQLGVASELGAIEDQKLEDAGINLSTEDGN